jgi:hypothetical protein
MNHLFWGKEQEATFHALKDKLTSDNILVYPRFDQLDKYPFIVEVDGSRNGFGATLMQKQPDGTEKVISYQARATRSCERNATATSLELCCLVQSLQWFSQYRTLAKFILRTDHISLTYIKNLKHSSQSKLLRYALLISEHDFDIEHIKGKKNLIADALSRRPFTDN